METKQAQAAKRKARILLVDDHLIVRDGLAQFINCEPDLMVCGQADNARQAFEMIPSLKPDLAIVDISLHGMSGMELIKNIKSLYPQLLVLVLSMHDESLYAERALRAGAKGYITKQKAASDVLEAIRRILDGGIYVSEKMTGQMLQKIASGGKAGGDSFTARLSDRELEVFQMIGQGYGTSKIAEELCLSVKTIETHRAHIMEKLNLNSAAELTKHAIHWAQEQPTPQPKN